MRHLPPLVLIVLALTVLACNLPGTVAPVTPTPTNNLALVTPTPLPDAATRTPAASGGSPTPTGTVCTPDVEFLNDVTIPDGTIVQPGSTFTKIWHIKNSGTCDWDGSFRLVQTGGAALTATPADIPLPPLKVGLDVEIGVSIAVASTAPPGDSQSALFELRDPGGRKFGQIYALVNISDPADLADQFGYNPGATPPPNGQLGGSLTLGGAVWNDLCIPPNAEGSGNPQQGICVSTPGNGLQADGVLQPDETGIGGITVSLFGSVTCIDLVSATPIATTVTDADGLYKFEGLKLGGYCVWINMQNPDNIAVLVPGTWTRPHGEALYAGALIFESRMNIDFGWDYQLK